jgi:hypothetical protein
MRFDAVPAASIAFLVWLSRNCGNENDIDCRFGADRPLRQIKSQFLNVTFMPREPVPNARWRIEIKKLLKTIGRVDHFQSICTGCRISLQVIAMENPEPSDTRVVLVIAGNWIARSTSTRRRLRAIPIRGNASGPAALSPQERNPRLDEGLSLSAQIRGGNRIASTVTTASVPVEGWRSDYSSRQRRKIGNFTYSPKQNADGDIMVGVRGWYDVRKN